MSTSKNPSDSINILAEACNAFRSAVATYEESMDDGFNVHGAIAGVMGHAMNVRLAANVLCDELERKEDPTHEDVWNAANNAAFIRVADDQEWLRIDAIDGGVTTPLTILAHNENSEVAGTRRLLIDEIDPKAVSFMLLKEFKL